MIPSFFIFIDKMPLTSSGKIDRKALPAPDFSIRQIADNFVEAMKPLEIELVIIWSEVLRLEKLGFMITFLN